MEFLRVDGMRYGSSCCSGSGGELLTRRLILSLSMFGLVTGCWELHLLNVFGVDGEKKGRCVILCRWYRLDLICIHESQNLW